MSETYGGFGVALMAVDSDVGPSEGHGLLCALLCTEREDIFERWLDELSQQDVVGEARDTLRDLTRRTAAALASDHFEFQPLLPADQAPLSHRSAALSQWCTGFLYGIGAATWPVEPNLSDEAREILHDFTELTRLAEDEEDDAFEDNEAESHYQEIVEYLRIGVMYVYEELREANPSGSDAKWLH